MRRVVQLVLDGRVADAAPSGFALVEERVGRGIVKLDAVEFFWCEHHWEEATNAGVSESVVRECVQALLDADVMPDVKPACCMWNTPVLSGQA